MVYYQEIRFMNECMACLSFTNQLFGLSVRVSIKFEGEKFKKIPNTCKFIKKKQKGREVMKVIH